MIVPEAVTFDFWSTVAVPDLEGTRAARRRAIMDVLRRHDLWLDAGVLDMVFNEALDVFNQAWAENRQFTGYDAASHTADRLAAGRSQDLRDELIETFVGAAKSVQISLAPGVAQVLERLTAEGVPMAIICDVGMTPSAILREYLESNGVLAHFGHLTFSDEVGVYKPAVEMFEDAFGGLGTVDPSRSVHVGDLLRTDVAGARLFGMRSVRYTGVFDDSESLADADVEEADHVVSDHDLLLEVLGIL